MPKCLRWILLFRDGSKETVMCAKGGMAQTVELTRCFIKNIYNFVLLALCSQLFDLWSSLLPLERWDYLLCGCIGRNARRTRQAGGGGGRGRRRLHVFAATVAQSRSKTLDRNEKCTGVRVLLLYLTTAWQYKATHTFLSRYMILS